MAVPADWSVQFIRTNVNSLQGVSDPRLICPYCQNASTFGIRSQTLEVAGPLTTFYLLLQCNYARCHKLTHVVTSVVTTRNNQLPDDPFFMHPSRAVAPTHPSVPTQIADDWTEAQKAKHADAPKAAAVMFRRVLYGVLIDKGCKLHPLREGLTELIQGQRLPAIFDDWLPAIRDDGHDAAHPDRALQVSPENIAETMEYTAELLRFLYIEPYEFQQRRTRNAPANVAAS
jgi:hypothetical protein